MNGVDLNTRVFQEQIFHLGIKTRNGDFLN